MPEKNIREERDAVYADERKRLGEKLKKRRKALRLSQQEVANMVMAKHRQDGGTVYQTQVSHVEEGRGGFSIFREIADVLGMRLVFDAQEPSEMVTAPTRAHGIKAAVADAVEALVRLYDSGDAQAFRLVVELIGVAQKLDQNARDFLWAMVLDPNSALSGGFVEVEDEPTGS